MAKAKKKTRKAKRKTTAKSKAKVKRNGGRKSRYSTDIAPNFQSIQGWLRSGYTEESIANRLGMSRSTWERHKANHQAFRDVIQQARHDTGALAVNYLFKRVTGYEYTETTTETIEEKAKNGKMHVVKTVTKTVTKHMAPDVAACCFFIVNRMSEMWQHIQHIQHHGEAFNTLSDEDCNRIRQLLRANHEHNGDNGNGTEQ